MNQFNNIHKFLFLTITLLVYSCSLADETSVNKSKETSQKKALSLTSESSGYDDTYDYVEAPVTEVAYEDSYYGDTTYDSYDTSDSTYTDSTYTDSTYTDSTYTDTTYEESYTETSESSTSGESGSDSESSASTDTAEDSSSDDYYDYSVESSYDEWSELGIEYESLDYYGEGYYNPYADAVYQHNAALVAKFGESVWSDESETEVSAGTVSSSSTSSSTPSTADTTADVSTTSTPSIDPIVIDFKAPPPPTPDPVPTGWTILKIGGHMSTILSGAGILMAISQDECGLAGGLTVGNSVSIDTDVYTLYQGRGRNNRWLGFYWARHRCGPAPDLTCRLQSSADIKAACELNNPLPYDPPIGYTEEVGNCPAQMTQCACESLGQVQAAGEYQHCECQRQYDAEYGLCESSCYGDASTIPDSDDSARLACYNSCINDAQENLTACYDRPMNFIGQALPISTKGAIDLVACTLHLPVCAAIEIMTP